MYPFVLTMTAGTVLSLSSELLRIFSSRKTTMQTSESNNNVKSVEQKSTNANNASLHATKAIGSELRRRPTTAEVLKVEQ